MKLILVIVLGILAVVLVLVMTLLLVIGRNLKSMAAAVAQVSSLAERVEQEGKPSFSPPPKRSLKEIFAVLPSLLKRADSLPKK
jgi:hypothetical protein